MGLFSKLVKTESKPVQKTYTYKQASGFRGTKRFNIATFGDKFAETGIKAVFGADLKGANIAFKDIPNGLAVYVNENNIGALWANSDTDRAIIDRIKRNDVETIYIKVDTENVGGKDRQKAYLFAK